MSFRVLFCQLLFLVESSCGADQFRWNGHDAHQNRTSGLPHRTWQRAVVSIVTLVLTTPHLGGLSFDDFELALKIGLLSDLPPPLQPESLAELTKGCLYSS